jgi:hypothetical protein
MKRISRCLTCPKIESHKVEVLARIYFSKAEKIREKWDGGGGETFPAS